MKDSHELEKKLSDMLTEGEPDYGDREKREREQVSPKYEIRIQTEFDPILEETLKFRSMAKEVDDRYDAYMEKASRSSSENLLEKNTNSEKKE
ncbi:hypothetical protein [Paenibacillus sp. Marseille-Q4541]|uniref:hypothetical protein n=1 Tax=Paenibacillus sp. Marseille-Q4541 TaxID=2831522 RepID=UPI0032D5919A